MAQHSWTYDAPTGVYKSHTMSSELRYASIVDTKFMQFVSPEDGEGKKKGESVTITRISALTVPSNPRLTENQPIPEDAMSLTTTSITVSEFGRAVPYTSLADDLSVFNVENMVQRTLRDQMKVSLDNSAATVFKTCLVKAEATGVAALNFDTAGAATQQAIANLNVYHVEQIRDYMFSTLLVPPYEGDDYICLLSTKAKRGIVNDPAWETWHKYTDPESKYNAEIGRMENFRFVEVNNTGALSNSKGLNSVAGEALFFGADAVAMATAIDPELRAKTPTDFGRSKAVAWYGVLDFGQVWNTANAGEAKMVHFTST